MDQEKSPVPATPEFPGIEAEMPLGIALTLQRLSFSEVLREERASIEAARQKVKGAVSGFDQAPSKSINKN